jgi:hypothetical protein
VPRFVIKLALIGTLLTAPITPPVITYAFAHGGSEPWFAGGDIVGALLGLAPQPGSHGRRQASHERNFHPLSQGSADKRLTQAARSAAENVA